MRERKGESKGDTCRQMTVKKKGKNGGRGTEIQRPEVIDSHKVNF